MFVKGVEDKYPKELLNNRINTEGNVIACIYKDPMLLDETNLSIKDFITTDGRFYFSLASKLKKDKYNVFDEVSILSSSSESVIKEFESRGGYEQIQNMAEIVKVENWTTYINILYRDNLILKLFDDGFNLNRTVADSQGNEIIPLRLFKKMDSEAILDWYESRLATSGIGYSSKVLDDEIIEFDDKFIDELDEGMASGVPFDYAGIDINGENIRCFPFLSNQLSGYLPGTFNVIGGYSSVGKTTIWTSIIMSLIHHDRKVLIISNEQRASKFKIQFIAWSLYKYFRTSFLTKTKLQNGGFTKEEKEMLQTFNMWWKENYSNKIRFVSVADADMSTVKKKIRQYVLQDGFDTVLYDTFKLEFSSMNDNNNAWLSLIKDSRDFDMIAKKYNIIMLASLQLATHTLGKLFLDSSVLSMSKQIKEVLETLVLMRSTYNEELDKENKKYYCYPFQRKRLDNGEWVEEPYEPDMTAVYRTVFVDKGRNGTNSTDTGVAYLLKFNGAMGVFSEVALCRPKHANI